MKKFSETILMKSISIIIFSGAITQTVWADVETTTLPTILVNAEKQSDHADGRIAAQANLGALGEKANIDTPFTVTTYTDKIIEQQQASTVGEVLENDASIRATTNQGHLNENFQIRGFSVGYDDMSYNGLYAVAPMGRIPTELLESVTVLKGPNALVAGMAPAGSIGGVVIANSKRANQDLTRISSSLEDESYYKTNVDISRRFGDQKQFGVRVNGAYADGEHIVEGMNDRLALGSIAADYTTDKLKINFDSYAIRENRDNGSPAMVAMGVRDAHGHTLSQVIAAPKGDTNYFSQIHGQTNSKFAGLNGEYKLTPNTKVFAGLGYVEKEYSGHIFGTRIIVGQADGHATSQYYRVASKENNWSGNTGIETQFNTGTVKHTVGLRADYVNRKYDQHERATSSSFETNLYNPSSSGSMPTSYPKVVPYEDDKFLSYTLTDQLSMLDDKLQFILGVRYQDMQLKGLLNKTQYDEDKVSPSLGIVVKPFGENLSFYASYVEGLSKADSVSSTADVNEGKLFAPFETQQYEVGAKYQVGSWLNTLALYQIEKPTLITTTLAVKDSDGNTQITEDGGESRSRGVEWSFSGKVTEDLSLLGSMAYIDAEYTKGSTGTTNISGKTIYGVPDFTASLGLDYAIPFIEGLSVNTRANYVSEQYLDNLNKYKLPDYTIVDLGARYKTKLGGVNTTFLANVDNVTNKKYWEGVFNSNYATIGGARSYKMGVTFDF